MAEQLFNYSNHSESTEDTCESSDDLAALMHSTRQDQDGVAGSDLDDNQNGEERKESSVQNVQHGESGPLRPYTFERPRADWAAMLGLFRQNRHQQGNLTNVMNAPSPNDVVNANEHTDSGNQNHNGVADRNHSNQNSQDDMHDRTLHDSCLFCFEKYSNVQDHHLASIQCGHFFGYSCLLQWIRSSGDRAMCPVCNTGFTIKNIRKHYSTSVLQANSTRENRSARSMGEITNDLARLYRDCNQLMESYRRNILPPRGNGYVPEASLYAQTPTYANSPTLAATASYTAAAPYVPAPQYAIMPALSILPQPIVQHLALASPAQYQGFPAAPSAYHDVQYYPVNYPNFTPENTYNWNGVMNHHR